MRFFTKPSELAIVGLLCVLAAAAPSARADIIQSGGSFTVQGYNSPNTDGAWGPYTFTLTSGLTQTLGTEGLTVTPTIVSTANPNEEWVLFTFSATTGTSLANNINDYWETDVENLPFTQTAGLAAFFEYWSNNGTVVNPTSPFNGDVLETDPLNPAVGTIMGNSFSPLVSLPLSNGADLARGVYPYSNINSFGMDAASDNSYTIAGEFAPLTAAPEPASLTLFGIDVCALMGYGRKRRKANHRMS